MSHPAFGKTTDRIPAPDGQSAEIFRRQYRNNQEVVGEHWHEETKKVASATEAEQVMQQSIYDLIDKGVAKAVSFTVMTNSETGQVDRVIVTHLVERKAQ